MKNKDGNMRPNTAGNVFDVEYRFILDSLRARLLRLIVGDRYWRTELVVVTTDGTAVCLLQLRRSASCRSGASANRRGVKLVVSCYHSEHLSTDYGHLIFMVSRQSLVAISVHYCGTAA